MPSQTTSPRAGGSASLFDPVAPQRQPLWTSAFGAVVAFLILAGGLSAHGFLGDVGWDVADGVWILHHGFVPLHNYLSQAMYGAAWTNAEWLFGLYVGWLYQLLGRLGVYLGLLPVLAATAWLLALSSRRLGPYWELIWPAAAATTLLPVMSPRPQLFSYVLFAFALYALARWRAGDRLLIWLCAATSVLWTNSHGSAVLLPLALLLELLFADATGRRQLLWPLLLAVVLLAVHPGGLSGTLANLGHVGSSSNVTVIAEWASPDFHTPAFWLPLAALLAGFALLLPAMWRRRRYADAVLLVGASIAMLYAVRFLPYLMLVLALRGAEYVPPRLMLLSAPGAVRRSQLLGAVAVIALCAVLAPRQLFPARYPVKAFSWLRSHHVRNVFNSYAIGSTLEAVGLRPYLDGRDNLWLQRRWWPQYVAVSSGGESVLTYLRRFDPHARYVLWFARSPVALTLDASAHWRRVLVDPNRTNPQAATTGAYVIWQRVGP